MYALSSVCIKVLHNEKGSRDGLSGEPSDAISSIYYNSTTEMPKVKGLKGYEHLFTFICSLPCTSRGYLFHLFPIPDRQGNWTRALMISRPSVAMADLVAKDYFGRPALAADVVVIHY
jgi:hypothetical protein